MDTNIHMPESSERDPADIRHLQKIIEAILFAAGHPVSYEKLANSLNETPSFVQKIIRDYAEDYNRTDSPLPRGILLLTFEDSCQLCTKEEYGQYIRDALGIRRGGNLSNSSIEVLAIIAYNEPVTRAYIDTVRGVDSSYAINTLCEKELIEPCGRLDVPGRPLIYRTTDNFLRVFGIQSLKDLPEISILGKKAEEKIIALSDNTKEESEQESE